MKRREVYATTGTRICVRAFAGWDFSADEVQRPDFAREGYRRGELWWNLSWLAIIPVTSLLRRRARRVA